MNSLKLNVAIFSSLIFLLFAVVDTAMGDDYPADKLSKAMILVGKSQTIKLSALIRSPGTKAKEAMLRLNQSAHGK